MHVSNTVSTFLVRHGTPATTPLAAQYAAFGSGTNAAEIGWINFGTGFSLVPGQGPVRVTNTLRNGLLVSFDVQVLGVVPVEASPSVSYISSTVPIYQAAPFGNTAYTGLGGYPAIYTTASATLQTPVTTTLLINNISVRTCCGTAITNYLFYAADPETTNALLGGTPEVWQVEAMNGIWSLTTQMRSVSGALTGPTVTGTGTGTVTLTGTTTANDTTSSYVFSTRSPQSIVTTATVNDGAQGFAFGIQTFMNPTPTCRDNKKLKTNPVECVNKIKTGIETNFDYCSCDKLVGIVYGPNFYPFDGKVLTIVGAAGVYDWHGTYVNVSEVTSDCLEHEDSFLLVICKDNKVVFENAVFINYR
ncbi:MAG: hypothetical protein E7256_15585 [Lachnospiraceae bacterium]|nr:hypothetical protein [Lachnospiraceae bacterium]